MTGSAAAQDKLDFYEVLGLHYTADLDEIKSVYRSLARRYHPDTSHEPGARETFQRITAAYEVIGDPARRAEYDRWRREQGLVVEPPLKIAWTLSRRCLSLLGEPQVLYALLEISTSEQAATRRLPLNMCLVVDRSTSMQGKRMDQVKLAACRIIDDLRPEDALSIVTFSDRAEVVLSASEVLDRKAAKTRVIGIHPAGGTEILSGLVAALGEIMHARRSTGVNHIILLTDGRTYGDEGDSLSLAEEAGADGVGISAMGIGHDWNDKFLDLLASRTGGSSAYIDTPEKVDQFLAQRILGLGSVRAQDLRLQVELGADMTLRHAFKLTPFPQEVIIPEGGPLMLGALEGSLAMSLMLEFFIGPQREEGFQTLATFNLQGVLAGQAGQIGTVGRRLRVEVTAQPPEEPTPVSIISALGKLTVHRMQERAYQAAETGDTQGATRSLETLATRLMALGQPELAQAALAEADRLTRTGRLSGEGRIRLKYGTRSLLGLPAPKQGS